MISDRKIPTSTTAGPVPGNEFMDKTQVELTALFNYSFMTLENIAVEDNKISATAPTPLTGSLLAGMKFSFIMPAKNTGQLTLSIDGLTEVVIVTATGQPLVADELAQNQLIQIEFDGDNFRILGGGSSTGGGIYDYKTYIEDSTWTKPNGANINALVTIELLGAGGGGSPAGQGGGGGGARSVFEFKLSDLPQTLDVNVAPETPIGVKGKNSSVSHLSNVYALAYGGGFGYRSGGSGASQTADAMNGVHVRGGYPTNNKWDAGNGGPYERTNSSGGDGKLNGGGGGGGGGGVDNSTPFNGGDGGDSDYGGAGGAGGRDSSSVNVGLAGKSAYSGDGGPVDGNGKAPAGGGGANGKGARGEVRIRVIG